MLICRECGGELTFSNSEYFCKSCGCKFSLNDLWENVDVCILNNESSTRGSRTTSSYIAEDIYNNLKSRKINSYFVRVSALNLFGEHIERSRISALNGAKIVIIVGTSADEFDALANKYSSLLQHKTVIPVFKEMHVNSLPKNISAIQGIDYGKIGACEDLVKGILNLLGRSDEYDFITVSNKNIKNKKIITTLFIIFTLILLCCFVLIFNPFKQHNDTASSQNQNSVADNYSTAMQLFSEEKYADALTIYLSNPNYKDSQKQIDLIYQKFAGFYHNEDSSLHLQIWEGNVANLELTCFLDDKEMYIINETVHLTGKRNTCEFNDSENNKGVLTIEFANDTIILEVITTEIVSDVVVENAKFSFILKNKSESSIQSITTEQLRNFVQNGNTIQDLTRMGIQTEYYDNHWHAPPRKTYKIKNTNIILFVKEDNEIIYFFAQLNEDGTITSEEELPECF